MPDVNDPRAGDVFVSTVNGTTGQVLYVDPNVVLLRFESGNNLLEKPQNFAEHWKVPPPPMVLRTGDCYWFDGERLVSMGSLECIKGHLSGHESWALKDHLDPLYYEDEIAGEARATHSYTLTPIDDWDDELDDDGRCDDPECCE